ncbi:MAG TPA: metallophosphoesterase family protein [Chloroflexota bacterium]|jgi:predicted phosphodiesterase
MRLAVLSDIHGNPIALDAVLQDVQSTGGADLFLLLGDLVAIGYDPIGVLERIAALPNVCCVQGNTDRYVVTGQRPHPSIEDAQADPELVSRIVEVANSFAWTQGVISAGGWFNWLAGLPLEQRFDLSDGTRLLGVHVAPGQDDGVGIHPRLSDVELAEHVANAQADLICVGHTHWPLDRTVSGGRVINSGSVSNPAAFDLRASYAIIEATAEGLRVEHRRVAYDVEAVIEAVERSHHPSGAFIISHFRGERRPWWSYS